MWEGAEEFSQHMARSTEAILGEAETRLHQAESIMLDPDPATRHGPMDQYRSEIGPRSVTPQAEYYEDRRDREQGQNLLEQQVGGLRDVGRRASGGLQHIANVIGPPGWVAGAAGITAANRWSIPGDNRKGFGEHYQDVIEGYGGVGDWAMEKLESSGSRLKELGVQTSDMIAGEMLLPLAPFSMPKLARLGSRLGSGMDSAGDAALIGSGRGMQVTEMGGMTSVPKHIGDGGLAAERRAYHTREQQRLSLEEVADDTDWALTTPIIHPAHAVDELAETRERREYSRQAHGILTRTEPDPPPTPAVPMGQDEVDFVRSWQYSMNDLTRAARGEDVDWALEILGEMDELEHGSNVAFEAFEIAEELAQEGNGRAAHTLRQAVQDYAGTLPDSIRSQYTEEAWRLSAWSPSAMTNQVLPPAQPQLRPQDTDTLGVTDPEAHAREAQRLMDEVDPPSEETLRLRREQADATQPTELTGDELDPRASDQPPSSPEGSSGGNLQSTGTQIEPSTSWQENWTASHEAYLRANRGVDEQLFEVDHDPVDAELRIAEYLEDGDFDEAYAIARQYDYDISVDGTVTAQPSPYSSAEEATARYRARNPEPLRMPSDQELNTARRERPRAGDEANMSEAELRSRALDRRVAADDPLGGTNLTEREMHLQQQEGIDRIADGRMQDLAQPFEPSALHPAPKNMSDDLPARSGWNVEESLRWAKSGNHLKWADKEKSQFIGAPKGVGSRQSMEAMRDSFDEDVRRGLAGAHWYSRSRESIGGLSRTVEGAGGMARELAMMSSQASPTLDYAWTIEGHNAIAGGEPGRSILHTGKQWKGMQRDPVGPLSLKTDPFATTLTPGSEGMAYPVNDRWMLDAYGYPSNLKSASGSQHRFMDAETLLSMERMNAESLGGRSNWDLEQIQAMAWTTKKAEFLVRTRNISFDEALVLAAEDFSGLVPWHRGAGTYEATPGAAGQLEPLRDAPIEVRQAYHDDPRSSWTDEEGMDDLYDAVGMYQEPTIEAHGVYRNAEGQLERNPARIAQPQVAVTGVPVPGADRKVGKHVPATDRAMMKKVEAVRGYVDAQQMSASHKDIPVGKKHGGSGATMDQATGFTIQHGVDLTPGQMDEIIRVAEEFGFPMDNAIISNRGQSTVISGFEPRGGLADQAEPLRGALAEAGVPMREGAGGMYPSRLDSDATFYDWSEPGSGSATRALFEVLDGPDAPEVLARLDADTAWRQRALDRVERDADMSVEHGWATRSDIRTALKIIGEQGLTALWQALRDGAVLPSVALPVLLMGMQEELDEAA